MKKRTRMIVLPHGDRTQLAADFKTTYQTVYSALHFITDSPKARMLRAAAIERGGVEFPRSQTN